MPVQRCMINGKSGWKWGSKGKCYTGPDAKAKAAKQGAKIHTGGNMESLSKAVDRYILQLQTFPAVRVNESEEGLTQYRKELIKTGKYIHPNTKVEFEVTVATLDYWVRTFNRWVGNGNHVPIPLGHAREGKPEANVGWVTSMMREENSLIGIMELVDTDLSLTTDVSICIESKVTDGKGEEYTNIITHVALCTNPVIAGLEGFEKLSLSGDTSMKFLEKIGKALGLASDASTEESVMEALEKINKDPEKDTKVDLSNADYVVKMLSENRTIKLSNLVKAGLITPAVSEAITAEYVEPKALALSMQSGKEDGFDFLYNVLVQNNPVALEEVTGVQNLELVNNQDVKPNALQLDIQRRRKAAGLKD